MVCKTRNILLDYHFQNFLSILPFLVVVTAGNFYPYQGVLFPRNGLMWFIAENDCSRVVSIAGMSESNYSANH